MADPRTWPAGSGSEGFPETEAKRFESPIESAPFHNPPAWRENFLLNRFTGCGSTKIIQTIDLGDFTLEGEFNTVVSGDPIFTFGPKTFTYLDAADFLIGTKNWPYSSPAGQAPDVSDFYRDRYIAWREITWNRGPTGGRNIGHIRVEFSPATDAWESDPDGYTIGFQPGLLLREGFRASIVIGEQSPPLVGERYYLEHDGIGNTLWATRLSSNELYSPGGGMTWADVWGSPTGAPVWAPGLDNITLTGCDREVVKTVLLYEDADGEPIIGPLGDYDKFSWPPGNPP